MNNSVWNGLVLVTLAILGAGCGSGGPRLYKAGGIVTYKGVPVEGASVSFLHDDGNTAVGATDAAGKFQLIRVGSNREGTVAGKGSLSVTKMSGGTVVAGPGPGVPLDPSKMTDADRKKQADDMRSRMEGGPKLPEPPKSLLPTKYGDPATSGLKYEVLPKNDNNFVVELND